MSKELIVNKSLTEKEIYESLIPRIEALIDESLPVVSNLANVSSALKEAFEKISWVGFYLRKNDKLLLGPFQGKTACTTIEFGKGVCGTAAEKMETVIVNDVDKFPGHIACDSGSRSEIVVPIVVKNQVVGVLDIDSYTYSAFNSTDEKYLEQLVNILINKCDFTNFNLN